MLSWTPNKRAWGTLDATAGPAKFQIKPITAGSEKVECRWVLEVTEPSEPEQYAILRDMEIEVCKRFAVVVSRLNGWQD